MKGPSEETLDISSLLYDLSSSWSKISYFLLLMSSISSVCIDLAKILKWGEDPIITTYASFTFCKIFLFILSKFLVQSYVLSMAIKSMMFYFALTIDYEENSDIWNELLQFYYRGIYNTPQLLTFNQATLYAPLLILILLFLPSIICAFACSIWTTGMHSWSQNFVKTTVLFLFAVMSNMSYFSPGCNLVGPQEDVEKKENNITQSTIEENIHRDKFHLEVVDSIMKTPPLKRTVVNEMSSIKEESESPGSEHIHPAKHFGSQYTRNEDLEAVELDSTWESSLVENEVPEQEEKTLTG